MVQASYTPWAMMAAPKLPVDTVSHASQRPVKVWRPRVSCVPGFSLICGSSRGLRWRAPKARPEHAMATTLAASGPTPSLDTQPCTMGSTWPRKAVSSTRPTDAPRRTHTAAASAGCVARPKRRSTRRSVDQLISITASVLAFSTRKPTPMSGRAAARPSAHVVGSRKWPEAFTASKPPEEYTGTARKAWLARRVMSRPMLRPEGGSACLSRSVSITTELGLPARMSVATHTRGTTLEVVRAGAWSRLRVIEPRAGSR
mmetsp:Transcript_8285/g.28177  ORF Transcript_8285/g.28177 Transcript_8285/m.28177 type:complete len:258 (-) Transcript_8285:128-901(-)